MTWLVQSFDPRTEELLVEVDLDALASGAVERLIGAVPQALAPDQVRVVAPLFGIDPERWSEVVPSSTPDGTPDAAWLAVALDQLVGEVVEVPPDDLDVASYPVPWESAQGLLDRFSTDVRLPPGEVFLDVVAS